MASNKFLILMALAAVAAVAYSQVQQGGGHSDQGGPHQNQGRVRRQVPEDEVQVEEVVEDIEVAGLQATWVDCDFTATSKLSCLDCNTRVICKPIGGLVRYCNNPRRPYCNNGLCSDIPSAECT